MKNNNQGCPQAREAMDRFKMLVCQEVGVNLQSGFNASLTCRETGDFEGLMVKKICPMRNINLSEPVELLLDICTLWNT